MVSVLELVAVNTLAVDVSLIVSEYVISSYWVEVASVHLVQCFWVAAGNADEVCLTATVKGVAKAYVSVEDNLEVFF